MSQPSARALKAATEICEDGRWDEQVIARIIDREVSLPAQELARLVVRYSDGHFHDQDDLTSICIGMENEARELLRR